MGKFTYVGLDVHQKSITAVWGMRQGERRSATYPNTAEGLERMRQVIGTTSVWAVYEASGEGYGLHDRLERQGWRAEVLAPTKIRKSSSDRKRKTDLKDAEHLFELVLSHGELGTKLPTVWIPDQQTREHRELVRRRLKLGERISGVKAGIRSLLRLHEIEAPEKIVAKWTQKHLAWLRGLTQTEQLRAETRWVLASLLRELAMLQEEAAGLQQAVEKLAAEPRYEGQVKRMRQIRGVGTLTAMTYLVELGDVNRFPNRQAVGSYLGLVPTSHESGETQDRKGHITREGPAGIRKVLNQAAWCFVRLNPEWRRFYERLAIRRGKKKAIVAVMRKLGILLWHRAKAA